MDDLKKITNYVEFDPRDFIGYQSSDLKTGIIKALDINYTDDFETIVIGRVDNSVNLFYIKFTK